MYIMKYNYQIQQIKYGFQFIIKYTGKYETTVLKVCLNRKQDFVVNPVKW